MFREACHMGLEGIVSKRLGSAYASTRTRNWLKIKNPNFERRYDFFRCKIGDHLSRSCAIFR